MAKDREEVEKEFAELVNLTPKALEVRLETDDSKAVGQKDNGGESKGHESGRRILEIKQKKKSDYDEADLKQMSRTVSYFKRHLAQRPESDIKESPWRYSLMNWGHDPCKEGG